MQDYHKILNTIHAGLSQKKDKGKVASYIPELSNVKDDNFGIYLNIIGADDFYVGQTNVKFSIQSISKVLALSKAFEIKGNDIWNRIDVELSIF